MQESFFYQREIHSQQLNWENNVVTSQADQGTDQNTGIDYGQMRSLSYNRKPLLFESKWLDLSHIMNI